MTPDFRKHTRAFAEYHRAYAAFVQDGKPWLAKVAVEYIDTLQAYAQACYRAMPASEQAALAGELAYLNVRAALVRQHAVMLWGPITVYA